MKKDDTAYLHHILECIRRIEEDIEEGRERFMASHTLQDAVLRNLQVIAESTQRLSEAVKSTQPDIEWQKMVDFDNRLRHAYHATDVNIVWDIVRSHLPPLKSFVERRIHGTSR